MSDSNAPQQPVVANLVDTSVDTWMSALATSPAPRPRLLSTATLLRRARLEARLKVQRSQTQRALRPAFIAEAVGVLSTASFGVYLSASLSSSDALRGLAGLNDAVGAVSLIGLGSTGTVISLLLTLLFILWFIGDEAALRR